MDNFDRKLRRFLVDEGYLFPITDAEIERALKEVETMSAHNHDEEFIKQTVGKKLQKRADNLKDEMVKNAILKANIKGLSRGEAKAKLNNIVDEIFGE